MKSDFNTNLKLNENTSIDKLQMKKYREELPEGCPPDVATNIKDKTVVYRLIKNNPVVEEDFNSWRALHPNKRRPIDISECQALGLSVMDNLDATKNYKKIPKFRNYKIAKLTLGNGAGFIKKTGKSGHYTWWPLADYDIIGTCELLL